MIAHQKRFKDTVIFLDGSTFVGCTFQRCTLVFSGLIPGSTDKCDFEDCNWQFAGPAANSVQFMTWLYTHGGQELVDRIFDDIRQGRRPQGITLN